MVAGGKAIRGGGGGGNGSGNRSGIEIKWGKKIGEKRAIGKKKLCREGERPRQRTIRPKQREEKKIPSPRKGKTREVLSKKRKKASRGVWES